MKTRMGRRICAACEEPYQDEAQEKCGCEEPKVTPVAFKGEDGVTRNEPTEEYYGNKGEER